jgi:hypothetical protein
VSRTTLVELEFINLQHYRMDSGLSRADSPVASFERSSACR